jgi:hypothetical protein
MNHTPGRPGPGSVASAVLVSLLSTVAGDMRVFGGGLEIGLALLLSEGNGSLSRTGRR